ncbi:MAG: hypothetical protein M3Y72_03020 [Acidobacteriota bacterium]|nr:hypothetical protein [Acidobacteriota bacterium]
MRLRNYMCMSSRLFGTVRIRFALLAGIGALLLAEGAMAQTVVAPPQTRVSQGYTVHQSIDAGGRIAQERGSLSMYDTLVNVHSGPRIFEQAIEMHAVPGAKHFFLYDSLTATNAGYGGDPENVTVLRMSKGKLYDFQGMFRRDREYFDYDLLDNPLVPAGLTSNGYTFPQALHSPHLFNTVRRMTDTSLTLFPLSRIDLRAGYSQNISQGPSYSSLHDGAEAQFLQNWRNSTDTWFAAVDGKLFHRTLLTFQETITHYKGNTNYQLAGTDLQLPNGQPYTLGYDAVTIPKCNDGTPPILSATTKPPTVNPTCAGFQTFSRNAPTRTLFPTEEFRFQSSDLKKVSMTGRIRYTGASMKLPQFVENFEGLDNQGIRQWNITGYSKAERVNVSGDVGAVWQMSPHFSLAEQYDFWYFRQPADNYLSEIDRLDDVNPDTPSMLDPPGAAQPPVLTNAHTYLSQKTETNRLTLGWKASSRASFSLGYKYRARTIAFAMPLITDFFANGTAYTVPIHENAGLFGVVLRPSNQWKINGSFEAAFFDNAYVQPDPRQSYRYQLHTMWTPKSFVTITGALDGVERRDKQVLVDHVDHNRSVGIGAEISPNVHYGLDINYGYTDSYTSTGICYSSTPGLPNVPKNAPADCGTNTYLGTARYDEPTQYGSFDVMVAPLKQVQAHVGYRINAVNGSTTTFNPRQVPGSLQSRYQTPFANVKWTTTKGLGLSGEWNYYDYGEQGAVGPTLPRDFHTNLYALGVHYEF